MNNNAGKETNQINNINANRANNTQQNKKRHLRKMGNPKMIKAKLVITSEKTTLLCNGKRL